MRITKPGYYDRFRCIAGSCPDSCCKEWEVEVDAASAARYRSLTGPLGDRLRQVLRDDGDVTRMTIEDGRCPMWRQDGLCRIQAEQGEDALCQVCREFPRLRHDYGDLLELGLELSCPEAARLILTAPAQPRLTEEIPGGEEPEYDAEAMAVLLATREKALAILEDADRGTGEILALLLLYGYQAQGELDGEEEVPFRPEEALDSVREFVKCADFSEITGFFRGLELLTEVWGTRLQSASGAAPGRECLALARYLVERYWLQAVSDYDLYCRVKFAVVACLLVSRLGGDFVETAQLFSKEIENNCDNVEAILDAAYAHSAFTDDKILGWLLQTE